MVKQFKIIDVLEYYDAAIVVECIDYSYNHYIGILIPNDGDAMEYYVVRVSPKRLRQLHAAIINVRSAYEKPDYADELYILEMRSDDYSNWYSATSHADSIPQQYLPSEHYFLAPIDDSADANTMSK